MADENGIFKIGAVQSPLTGSTSNHPLQDSDPIVWSMRQFVDSVLKLHLGTRLNAELTGLGLSTITDGYCVNEHIAYDPIPFGRLSQYNFPLMCIYRVSGEPIRLTTHKKRVKSQIRLLYLFEPKSPKAFDRLMPLLTHAYRIIVDRMLAGHDENYLNNSDVFANTGLKKVSVMNYDINSFQNLNTYGISSISQNNFDDMFYPGLMMDFEIEESVEYVAGNYENFTGVDATLDIEPDVATDDDELEFIVQASEV